jgi:hypothetical protein
MLAATQAFLIAYWYFVLPVVTLLFLLIPIIIYWENVRYWLMKVRIHTPLVGRLRYWVKHPGQQDQDTGFLGAEKQLCGAYNHYYAVHDVDPNFFRKCQDYLAKINEDGRREKSAGVWVLVITLMLIEATAFGYALAPFALTLATPNTALAGAFGIGLVISIIGLALSEFSGRALYMNSVVTHILSFGSMRKAGEDGDMVRKDLVTIDNTNVDDHRPEYQQMLNRVKVPKNGAKPAKRYGILIAYGVFIIGLAVAAFWVRAETLNAQEAELIANPPAASQTTDDFPLTSDMAQLGTEASGKSAQDQIDAMHRASLVTFAVLSGLFIFIQATSTYMALIFGFAGTHSRKAWELTYRFANADDFVRFHQSKARSIAVDAQQSLGALQGLMSNEFHVSGDDHGNKENRKLARTFENYVHHEHSKAQSKRVQAVGENTAAFIREYVDSTIESARKAIRNGEHARAREIITEAAPTVSRIKTDDPNLGQLKASFAELQQMFGSDVADHRPAPAVPEAPLATPAYDAPVAAPAPIEKAVAATPPTPAAEPAKVTAGRFDHHAWGDLTDYELEDLDFVAERLGVELPQLVRARRLQLLEKQVG